MSYGARADCAIGAKSKTSFVILDPQSVILKGGYGPDILVKTLSPVFFVGASMTVLKDNFCDFATAVFYVNGQVINAQEVKNL